MVLWTREHMMTLLPALVGMVLVGVVLRLTLGKRSEKVRMIPLQVIACIIVALEIGKQAVSFSRGYDLYHIPLHFCSIFIFALPAMAFYKGKHQDKVRAVTAAWSTATALLTVIYPDLIYGAGSIREFFVDYLSFHTVVFHNLVILACIVMVALDLHIPAPKGEPKAVATFVLCYCIVAAAAAQLLQTNYNNFYRCNIAPLETVRAAVAEVLGYGAAQALYVLIVTVLDILFVLMSYWLFRFLRKVFAGKQAVLK